jgi:hypothetical protein
MAVEKRIPFDFRIERDASVLNKCPVLKRTIAARKNAIVLKAYRWSASYLWHCLVFRLSW